MFIIIRNEIQFVLEYCGSRPPSDLCQQKPQRNMHSELAERVVAALLQRCNRRRMLAAKRIAQLRQQTKHESSVVVDEVGDSDHLACGVGAGDHEAGNDDLVDEPQLEDDCSGCNGGR